MAMDGLRWHRVQAAGDAERFFEELKKLIGDMNDEERRAAREELTEEELAIFDLLTRPEARLPSDARRGPGGNPHEAERATRGAIPAGHVGQ
jgi:hypothetical protein